MCVTLSAEVHLRATVLRNNTAGAGGAIYIQTARLLNMSHVELLGNIAKDLGGALSVGGTAGGFIIVQRGVTQQL